MEQKQPFHTYTHTDTHPHTHLYTHTHTHKHPHTHKHTHTHTYTNAGVIIKKWFPGNKHTVPWNSEVICLTNLSLIGISVH